MKYTLNDVMARVNQVLNYPSISYEDIYHFFDQAIAELNTSLRIGVPNVSEMVSEHTFTITERGDVVRLTSRPGNDTRIPRYSTLEEAPSDGKTVDHIYVCGDSFFNRKFYKWDGSKWVETHHLYAIYVDYASKNIEKLAYSAVAISSEIAIWVPIDYENVEEFDLQDYLTTDWWTLFVIPYVCFKFAVRNGDDGALFSDEFTQGFQQLQSSYHVPSEVELRYVAGHPAYAQLVQDNATNLTLKVKTRAITKSMRVGTSVRASYGGFYDVGGWGL